jgi:hypothetical protein
LGPTGDGDGDGGGIPRDRSGPAGKEVEAIGPPGVCAESWSPASGPVR